MYIEYFLVTLSYCIVPINGINFTENVHTDSPYLYDGSISIFVVFFHLSLDKYIWDVACCEEMVNEFPQQNLKGASVASPWNENLFMVKHDSAPLENEQAKQFHTVTMQGLVLCKGGHLDIAPAIAYLTTHVQKTILH